MWWSIGQFSSNWTSGFSKFWGFCYKLYAQANFIILNLNWTCYHCIRACIMTFFLFMHHIDCYFYIFLVLTCSLRLVFSFCSFWFFFVCLVISWAPCLGKLEPIGMPPLLLTHLLIVRDFRAWKTKRSIWS